MSASAAAARESRRPAAVARDTCRVGAGVTGTARNSGKWAAAVRGISVVPSRWWMSPAAVA